MRPAEGPKFGQVDSGFNDLAFDSGRIVDFEKIYLKFMHSIIDDILFLAWLGEFSIFSCSFDTWACSHQKGGGTEVYEVSPLQGAEMIEVRRDSKMSELLEKMKLSDSTHEVAGDAQRC